MEEKPQTGAWWWEEGVSGEAEKGESLSQVGLPKHDGLFTCQVVAFVWASHERQKRQSFSSSPSRTTSVVWVCKSAYVCSCCRVVHSCRCVCLHACLISSHVPMRVLCVRLFC